MAIDIITEPTEMVKTLNVVAIIIVFTGLAIFLYFYIW